MSSPHVVLGGGTCEANTLRGNTESRWCGFPRVFVDGFGCSPRCESELESIACSPLQIRHRRAHVPRSSLALSGNHGKRNGPPVKPLQQSAARLRDLNDPACRPWWTTTGSVVAT